MRRPRLSYANVIGTLAIFVALSGTATAAVTVSGSSIKDRSIPHKKVVLNTLTGAEINESTLGRVPNADKLDGIDSSAFARGANVRITHMSRLLNGDDATFVRFISAAGLGTLNLRCTTAGDGMSVQWANTTTGLEEYVWSKTAEPNSIGVDGNTVNPGTFINHAAAGNWHASLTVYGADPSRSASFDLSGVTHAGAPGHCLASMVAFTG